MVVGRGPAFCSRTAPPGVKVLRLYDNLFSVTILFLILVDDKDIRYDNS